MRYAIVLALLCMILGLLAGIGLQLHQVLDEMIKICATTRGCTP